MGTKLFDHYSIVHFFFGVIFYLLKVPLWLHILLHILFEYVENTPTGMLLINTYLPFWIGGKDSADSLLNSFGDVLSAIIGWEFAHLIFS